MTFGKLHQGTWSETLMEGVARYKCECGIVSDEKMEHRRLSQEVRGGTLLISEEDQLCNAVQQWMDDAE